MRSTAPGSCGICLGAVGMALHHKLCHTLGGASTCRTPRPTSIVLPHAVAYNAPRDAAEAMARIAAALGAEDAAIGLYDLAGAHRRAERRCEDLGMPRDGDRAGGGARARQSLLESASVGRDRRPAADRTRLDGSAAATRRSERQTPNEATGEESNEQTDSSASRAAVPERRARRPARRSRRGRCSRRPCAPPTLKLGYVSPRTGPLAAFGEPDDFILGLVRER